MDITEVGYSGIDFLKGVWENLGTPKFGGRVEVLANVSSSKSMSGMNQAHMVSAAKVSLAFISVSCIAAGVWASAKAITRNYSVRDSHKFFQSQSLIPLSKGEKEPIAGPISALSRIKALFRCKVLPLTVALSVIAGGVFIAPHINYFANAFKKS